MIWHSLSWPLQKILLNGGRHKVLGSEVLNIPPQTSTIASHLPKAVGTAFSIDRAKDLDIIERKLNKDSIVLCSFGDASVNHATALSAFNTATWISTQGGHVPSYLYVKTMEQEFLFLQMKIGSRRISRVVMDGIYPGKWIRHFRSN
ncbi:hypothetical protein Ct9H90mP29_19180 [bacterium]|nr:MAG: hypothetical protein Ct9H90mP29_19180 [bacterium]